MSGGIAARREASAPARYAVLGHPVEHSQSPFIHAEFARATGEPVLYERVSCPLDAFADTVAAFASTGASGCNVTMPFKFAAFDLVRVTSSRARLAAACNTIRFDADGWHGDNTDGVGLVHDIERNAGVEIRGTRLLLIGAGGGAAGAPRCLDRGRGQRDRRRQPKHRAGRSAGRAPSAVRERDGDSTACDGARRMRRCVRHRRQRQLEQRRRRGVARAAIGAQGGHAGHRHDVRPCRARFRRLGARARRERPRWPRHARRAGGGSVLVLARGAAANRRGAGGLAPAASTRHDRRMSVSRRSSLARGLALLCIAAISLQVYFLLRVALMTVVDPTIDDLRALRSLAPRARAARARVAATLGRLPGDLAQPRARRDRLGRRRVHRAQRRRMGRARKGLGPQPASRSGGSESQRARDEAGAGAPSVGAAGARRQGRRRIDDLATAGQESLSGRRAQLAAQGPGACSHVGARSPARQAPHPRDLSRQRRMGAKACSARRPRRATTSTSALPACPWRRPRSWP